MSNPKKGQKLVREFRAGVAVYETASSEIQSSEVGSLNDGNTLLTVHRIIAEMHEVGIADKTTMRKFDELCLTPIASFQPSEIRDLRVREGLSQAVLAKVLNVTVSTVGQWERGEKKPSGAALKLLSLLHVKGVSAVF